MLTRFLSLPKGFSILLGLLAAGALAAQVLTAGPTTTTLETALFSVLQFIFSIAFAWVMTGIAARREFVESQKAFAVAAYRRINEIDEGVERLLARAQAQTRSASPELRHELEVTCAIAMGVRSSIKSSIADWGDVIGEEISTINRIERIQDQQEVLLDAPSPADSEADNLAEAEALRDEIAKSNEQIARLLETLPPSLRMVADKSKRSKDPVVELRERMNEEVEETSTLRLRAFWEPSLDRDIRSMTVGDRLCVDVGTVGVRILGVCARDSEGQTVGIVTNVGSRYNVLSRYYIFREALVSYFYSTSIPVVIAEIDSESVGERHYFDLVVAPEAMVERVRRREDAIQAAREKQRRRDARSH